MSIGNLTGPHKGTATASIALLQSYMLSAGFLKRISARVEREMRRNVYFMSLTTTSDKRDLSFTQREALSS